MIVEHRPNGQVFVNGLLVAEVVELDPPLVVGRDTLVAELSAHRIGSIVCERLTDLCRYVELGGPGNPDVKARLTEAERQEFGEAMMSGLAGDPGVLTGRRYYRDGYRAGETLRALRDRLAEVLSDEDLYKCLE